MLIIGAGATIDLIILPPLREACLVTCVPLLLAGVGAFKPPLCTEHKARDRGHLPRKHPWSKLKIPLSANSPPLLARG